MKCELADLSLIHRLQTVRQFFVDDAVIDATLTALREFGEHCHEGLVLWLGDIDETGAHVTRMFVPNQESISDERGVGYFVKGETLFYLNRTLAESGLRLIAQVHSHPSEAYHSEADDRYAIVTAEGGLSLVVPDFGNAPADVAEWAVFRLSDGTWEELSSSDIRSLIRVIAKEK